MYAELRDWLGGQMGEADAVVVKDPRTGWFLPLWTRASTDLGVEARFVTMLRHPAEILASAAKSYGDWQTPGEPRRGVDQHHARDRARDARQQARVRALRGPARRLAARGEPDGRAARPPGAVRGRPSRALPQVDEFVDPTLHRNRVGWDELDVPARVRDMAEEVWQLLQPLADPGGDTPACIARSTTRAPRTARCTPRRRRSRSRRSPPPGRARGPRSGSTSRPRRRPR